MLPSAIVLMYLRSAIATYYPLNVGSSDTILHGHIREGIILLALKPDPPYPSETLFDILMQRMQQKFCGTCL